MLVRYLDNARGAMVRNWFGTLLVLMFCLVGQAYGEQPAPKVILETSLGAITVELNPQAAPRTVENFLNYVDTGFFDNTIFHRVIKGFMIQGGGFTQDLVQKKTGPAIANEADNGLTNRRGTIAMARTGDPHSATSQFFINTVDNAMLNHSGKTPQGWGYCVFGKVTAGMEVVDAIAAQPTTTRNLQNDVPVKMVMIKRAIRVAVKPDEASKPKP